MKERTKKISAVFLVLLAVSTFFASSLVAHASVDSNIEYSFVVKANNGLNKDPDGRRRQTSNNNNAWKVNLRVSGEGDKTATKFRLCLKDDSAASAWHTVIQGSGSHYYATNDAADHKTVYLQGQNNNTSTKSYKVSGYWDEETGILPD